MAVPDTRWTAGANLESEPYGYRARVRTPAEHDHLRSPLGWCSQRELSEEVRALSSTKRNTNSCTAARA